MSCLYDSQVTSQLSNYYALWTEKDSFDSLLSSNILCISQESSLHKELRSSQIVESETNVKKVIDAICSFTNPFNTERCAEEFYCLSCGLLAKLDVAADLLNACKICKASMEKFIQDRMVNHNVVFNNPIKRNKLKTFAKAEVKKTLKSTQNRMTQIKAEQNIFWQLVLLSVQNDIDLHVTLSYPLGPVPWLLATADGMPIKTDKAKLLHYLESSVEASLLRPRCCSIVDGNAVHSSLITSKT